MLVKIYGLKSTLCHIDEAVYTVRSDQSLQKPSSK